MARVDSLYLTEAEIAQRVGLKLEQWKATATVLERSGFPAPDPLFGNRRYWPACRAFLDRRYNMGAQSIGAIPALDGEERWNTPQSPARRRA